MEVSYLMIVGIFLIYYAFVLIFERKVIQEPKDIIDKFLSVVLLYAGVSLIFFSLTGQPFLGESPETYNIYIFIIGFIAVMWTIPNLLGEFSYFYKFAKKRDKRRRPPAKRAIARTAARKKKK